MSCNIHEWILRSLTHPSKPIHLSNTTAALRAFIAARYFQQLENKNKKTALLVICPNEDNARTFCNDIESLSSLTGNKKINPYFFPTWERSPYSPITLSLQTRHLRLACLSQLIRKQFPFILVTTLPAAFQASFPKEHFEDLCIKIEVASSTWSRENLIQQLTHFGYLRVDPVEDPGTFAVRGDILDVFPPDSEQPFRIEIFGDEIEKIREFNPTTQRTSSEKTIHSLEIIPAREVLIHHNNSAILREKVKQRADDLGIPRIVRDPIISSIREGIYPEQSDSWAPFAYSNSTTLWDLLPEDYSILWNDESDCQEEWKAFIAEQKKLEEQLSDRELIVPKVDELYSRNSDQDKIIQSHSKLVFDQIEWTDSKSLTDSETDSDTNVRLNVHSIPTLVKESRHSLSELTQWLKSFARKNYQITIFASTQTQLERIKFLLSEHAIDTASLSLGSLSQGFIWEEEKLLVLSESEILGSPHSRKLRKPSRTEAEAESAAQNWSDLQTLSDLGVGDGVVHIDHGIGKYQGLVRLELGGAASDFLLLEYANKDKLYLPVYRLNTIQKYVGSIQQVSLDRLGSQQFAKTKEKVKNAVKTLAIDLVQLYAERKIRPGVPFSPRGSELREFEAQFPFDETPDQLKAIDSIMNDLESGRVMDRLVCGDVGYGKTEVAIRAAFQAISNGKQVAVLVPTTLLAQQHELSFKERFKTYPIIIESISRFKTTREQKALLEATAQGKLDLLIGTHRLLSRDVQFQDLGLIIVDEEHRFGVEHKEKLKTLKTNTHVLTLTATPIPRTLHMALSGLRDISLMRTPPVNRLPIRTYVSRYDDELIQRAIEFELSRGGQVFFLHNRVQTIYKKAEQIRKLLPQAKVIVAHGQMPEGELENQMLTFYQKKANVLICTTIIEAGLDLPSANTLIVDRADTLGLAQLYQIRGRVGRSETRGYAYLLTPAESILTTEAKRRLEVIQRFVELGSGFNIASHDLEIRGGGDLLGPQQSGHIASVGFELYTELLEEAIREIQGKPLAPEQSRREPEIKTPFPSFLSESYVPDVHQRLSLYRRLSGTQKDSEIDQIEEELNDRFGALPTEAQNLVWIIRIKLLLKQMGMEGLTVGPEKISLLTGPLSQIDPVRGITLISSYPNRYQLTPDSKLVVKTATNSLRDLYFNIEQIFRDFCKS